MEGRARSKLTKTSCSGLLAAVMAVSACGTRAHAPEAGGFQPTAAAPAASDPGPERLVNPVSGSTGPVGEASEVPRGPNASGSAGQAPSTAPPAAANGGVPAVKPGSASVSDRSGGEKPVPAASPAGVPAPANDGVQESGPSARSEVAVASVGTYSGPISPTSAPMLQGAQLWVKQINAKGGLNGHPVKLLAFDDGGDAARHRAQVQEAIERHRIIAFLANFEAITGESSAAYIKEKRVPIVGISGAEDWAYFNPMYFPQKTAGVPFYRAAVASVAQQLIPTGKKRLATMICVEASGCDNLDRVSAESAQTYGFDHVYRARVSVAQPDYTANCLGARNAGAEVVFLAVDALTVSRVAASCARQGYRPIFSGLASLVVDRQKDDPNLADRMVASSNVFPWFDQHTPAAQEFQAAKRLYGNSVVDGIALAEGWTAGKLLEKAGAHLPEPATSAAVLEGLWSVSGDTLDGLTAPLRFERDKPPPVVTCWFNVAIRDGTWVSPDNFKQNCLEGLGPE